MKISEKEKSSSLTSPLLDEGNEPDDPKLDPSVMPDIFELFCLLD